MARPLDLLLVLTSFFAFTYAHNIQMKAHSRECFHETLHKDDKMTVTFQVGDREFGGSGNLDIDFWVRRTQEPVDGARDLSRLKRLGYRATHSHKCPPRFKIRPVHIRATSVQSAPATTPSRRTRMANTPTASATSTGQRTRRRSASTSTASSMSRNTRRRMTRWRRKVRRHINLRSLSEMSREPAHMSFANQYYRSPTTLRAPRSSQRRARLHCCPRAHPPQYRRIN